MTPSNDSEVLTIGIFTIAQAVIGIRFAPSILRALSSRLLEPEAFEGRVTRFRLIGAVMILGGVFYLLDNLTVTSR